MGSKVCTLKMLDEVADDMRLEWPGRRLRPIRSIYEDSYEPSARSERGD